MKYNGINNSQRRTLSTNTSYKEILGDIKLFNEIDCLICVIFLEKLTGYADTINLHIMNDGSGAMIGCMCR